MDNPNVSKKFLCVEFHGVDGEVVPYLSKCPANPEHIQAALVNLVEGADFVVSVCDEPKDFFNL